MYLRVELVELLMLVNILLFVYLLLLIVFKLTSLHDMNICYVNFEQSLTGSIEFKGKLQDVGTTRCIHSLGTFKLQ